MKDLAYWLRLRHTPKLGIKNLQLLLENYGSVQTICESSRNELKHAQLSDASIDFIKLQHLPEPIENELRWAEANNHHIIPLNSPNYPKQLKRIDNPPPLLYVKGNLQALQDPQLAIVGSRNPSSTGEETAYNFAKHFTDIGIIITSGLALGIDAASHRGVLAAKGATLAVMATGLDSIYPASHKTLATDIIEKGALISELPLGTKPKPGFFPQRNRIISGLSLGTLVIEAAIRSGSLITARHAMEQAREVFAIPGSIHNPLAKGCHHLIQQGAKLVENVQDILEEIAPQLSSMLKNSEDEKPITKLDTEYQQLLENLAYDPIPIDQLITRSGLPAESVSSMLLILELQGHITNHPGGLYSRLK